MEITLLGGKNITSITNKTSPPKAQITYDGDLGRRDHEGHMTRVSKGQDWWVYWAEDTPRQGMELEKFGERMETVHWESMGKRDKVGKIIHSQTLHSTLLNVSIGCPLLILKLTRTAQTELQVLSAQLPSSSFPSI